MLIMAGRLLAAMAILVVILGRRYRMVSAVGIFITLILFLASVRSFSDANPSVKYLYRSDGILGQLTVVEDRSDVPTRALYINRIPQTKVNPASLPLSLWKYPHRLAMIASMKPAGSQALLVGLGGGSLAMELKKMGFTLDAVEFDKRVPELAEKYFGFEPEGVGIFIDDGRRFIRNSEKKYDLVVVDVLNGEIQPHHLFTVEAFEEMKRILQPDGILIINTQGFLYGEPGLGARSVYKTLEESGFFVKYYFAGDTEHSGDIHFIASPTDFRFPINPADNINACCRAFPVDYPSLFFSLEVIAAQNKPDLGDAVILTDDRPALTALYNYSNEEWRSLTIQSLLLNKDEPIVTLFQ